MSKAFTIIETKSKLNRSPASIHLKPLARKDYEEFLDKNNPFHVLLSQKILNADSSDLDNERDIKEYEINHSLSYVNEIGKILKEGRFENHIKEEAFLIDEYSEINSDEIINIIEIKLNALIIKFNKSNMSDEKYFKSLLSTYIEKIREASIDESERRVLINRLTNSPKIQKIINEYWELPQMINNPDTTSP